MYCEQLVEGVEGCGEIVSSCWRVGRGVVYCEQLVEGVEGRGVLRAAGGRCGGVW